MVAEAWIEAGYRERLAGDSYWHRFGDIAPGCTGSERAQDPRGLQSFGPVVEEADEPVLHCEWARRFFALTLATRGGGQLKPRPRVARRGNPCRQIMTSVRHLPYLVGGAGAADARTRDVPRG